jgi:hypothetical protein
MGISRLLAKGWVLICLFTGAHALRFVLQSGSDLLVAIPQVVVSVLLFAAMGLLFVGGYSASGRSLRLSRFALANLKLSPVLPGFNEIVFLAFVVLSFLNQVVYAPTHISGSVTDAFEGALYFAIPGQRAVADTLESCAIDGGRVFASAFTWLLAIVFAGSAVSRLKLTAGIIRLERIARPEALSPTAVAAILGVGAVFVLQCVFVGSVLELVPCSAYVGVPGALIIGLGPLLLAYLIYAALAALLASGSEK